MLNNFLKQSQTHERPPVKYVTGTHILVTSLHVVRIFFLFHSHLVAQARVNWYVLILVDFLIIAQ